MMRLLNIEWKKLWPSLPFRILPALYFVSMWAVFYALQDQFFKKIHIDKAMETMLFSQLNIYKFPDIWANLTYTASYFHVIPAIIIIISITNEFSYRTIRQHVIDGMARGEFILSKFLTIAAITLASVLFLLVMGLSIGMARSGGEFIDAFQDIHYLLLFGLQMLGYLFIALLMGLLLKRSGIVIAIFLLYSWVIEKMLGFFLPDAVTGYLPLKAFNNLLPMPFGKYFTALLDKNEVADVVGAGEVSIALLYLAVMGFVCWKLVQKRDL